MTIDEKLDRLALRHEALTQSIELMAHDRREAFAKYDATLAKHADFLAEHNAMLAKHADAWTRNDDAMAKTQNMLAEVVESIDSLPRIAHLHEHRISNLEEGRA
jgi:hypothetical protein